MFEVFPEHLGTAERTRSEAVLRPHCTNLSRQLDLLYYLIRRWSTSQSLLSAHPRSSAKALHLYMTYQICFLFLNTTKNDPTAGHQICVSTYFLSLVSMLAPICDHMGLMTPPLYHSGRDSENTSTGVFLNIFHSLSPY